MPMIRSRKRLSCSRVGKVTGLTYCTFREVTEHVIEGRLTGRHA